MLKYISMLSCKSMLLVWLYFCELEKNISHYKVELQMYKFYSLFAFFLFTPTTIYL